MCYQVGAACFASEHEWEATVVTKLLRDAPTADLVRAIEANEIERFAHMSRLPGGEFHRGTRLTWFRTGIPYLLFNGVLNACLPPDDLDGHIARALAPFAARALPMFWMTGPSTQPADLGEHLLAAGCNDAGSLVGMAADLTTVLKDESGPPDLTIECVRDTPTLERWVSTYCAGFGYPAGVGRHFFVVYAGLGLETQSPLTHYLGRVAGEPVATASAFRGAGVVGLYSIATLPAWRRHGIGTAMTLAPLHDARSHGHQIGILHAEPAGLRLYRRLGFREYCTLRPYLWSPEPPGD
jgi:ribosomal protein S18 acetylase RimI-like enzyme